MFVEDEDFGVFTGEANRDWFVVAELAVDAKEGAVDGDFDGAVEIDEFGVGEVLFPDVVLPGWKDFSGEEDSVECLEGEFFEEAEIGDRDHNGGDPEEEGDSLVVQEFDKFGGEGGEGIGDETEGSAGGERGVEFEGVDIEVQRGEAGEAVGVREVEFFERPVDEVDDIAVVHDDAFGYAGGP